MHAHGGQCVGRAEPKPAGLSLERLSAVWFELKLRTAWFASQIFGVCCIAVRPSLALCFRIAYDFDHMAHSFEHLIKHLPADARCEHSLAKDEFLFRQQQPATAIFAVVSGRIRLFRDLPDGSRVTLHVARSGETFAEASLFSEHYHCYAQADLASTVMRLNSRQLLAAITANNELGMELSLILAAQVRDTRAMLSLRDIRSANERLLAWLRMNAKGDQMTVFIDRLWTGVSEELGLTREAVYRALAHLQQQGSIERDGRQDGIHAEIIHLLKK